MFFWRPWCVTILIGLWIWGGNPVAQAQSSGNSGSGSTATKQAAGQAGDIVGIAVLGVLGGVVEGSMIYFNVSALARRDYDFTFPLIGLILSSVGVGLTGVYLAVEKEPSYPLGVSILAVNGVLLVISAVHLGLFNRHNRRTKNKNNHKTVAPLPPSPPENSTHGSGQILWESF